MKIFRGGVWVNRHRNGAYFGDSQKRKKPFGGVIRPETHLVTGINAYFDETASATVNFPGQALEIITHTHFAMDYRILLRICGRNLFQQYADGFMDYLHAAISLQIMVVPINTKLALNFPLKQPLGLRWGFETISRKFTIKEIKF